MTLKEKVDKLKLDLEDVWERCPQYTHPSMPPCVLLTDKEWRKMKNTLRACYRLVDILTKNGDIYIEECRCGMAADDVWDLIEMGEES